MISISAFDPPPPPLPPFNIENYDIGFEEKFHRQHPDIEEEDWVETDDEGKLYEKEDLGGIYTESPIATPGVTFAPTQGRREFEREDYYGSIYRQEWHTVPK
jgi:hypothetical protein